MDQNFKEKIKIENLAVELLRIIPNIGECSQPLTSYQEEASEYCGEIYKVFKSSLSDEQIEDINTIISLKNDIDCTFETYSILHGMRLKTALDKLIEHPIEVLELLNKRKKMFKLAE